MPGPFMKTPTPTLMLSLATTLLLSLSTGFAATEPAEAPAPPTDLVVERGTARIEFVDVDARMAKIPSDKRAGYMNKPERIEETLQAMLLVKQFAAEARAAGLDREPLMAVELKQVQDELLAERFMARKLAAIEVPDFNNAAQERYITSPALYRTPEALDVRHLVVLRDIHGDVDARKRAEALLAEFKAKGGDFAEFVKQHSEEKSVGISGGLLPNLERGKAAGSFEEAAFALKDPGELSGVVSTRFGYHIIQLVGRRPSTRIPYEQVKDSILASLRNDYLARERVTMMDRYRSEPMHAEPDNVLALRTRYLPDGAGTQALRGVASLPTATAEGPVDSARTQPVPVDIKQP